MDTCKVCGAPLYTYGELTLHVLTQTVECVVPDPPASPTG